MWVLCSAGLVVLPNWLLKITTPANRTSRLFYPDKHRGTAGGSHELCVAAACHRLTTLSGDLQEDGGWQGVTLRWPRHGRGQGRQECMALSVARNPVPHTPWGFKCTACKLFPRGQAARGTGWYAGCEQGLRLNH